MMRISRVSKLTKKLDSNKETEMNEELREEVHELNDELREEIQELREEVQKLIKLVEGCEIIKRTT